MLNTVIFDMDGLLIDSEPQWQEAGMETLLGFGAEITLKQYYSTTGLRTREWLEYWFTSFGIDLSNIGYANKQLEDKAIEKIDRFSAPFPGTEYILHFFRERNFKIGLATSSPLRLVEVVVNKLGLHSFFDAVSSAEYLPLGKPHPQVYINCAEALGSSPLQCLCFEDSFNGFISAKAARMKCVVVPGKEQQQEIKWKAADLTLSSLRDFNLQSLSAFS